MTIGFPSRLKQFFSGKLLDSATLYFALRDPRVGLVPKLITAAVGIYVVSPIDFIPDLLAFFGLADDALIVPLGTSLALQTVPDPVLVQARTQAIAKRKVWTGVAIGIGLLVLLVMVALVMLLRSL